MGYIHCCSGLRKTRSFTLSPEKNYQYAQVDYLEECPICGHTITQLTRIDAKNKISTCRKINDKARKFFGALKSSILYEKNPECQTYNTSSKFYLYYNEFGKKKKCYSNLSSLKIGLFENKEYSQIV